MLAYKIDSKSLNKSISILSTKNIKSESANIGIKINIAPQNSARTIDKCEVFGRYRIFFLESKKL